MKKDKPIQYYKLISVVSEVISVYDSYDKLLVLCFQIITLHIYTLPNKNKTKKEKRGIPCKSTETHSQQEYNPQFLINYC